MAVRFFKIKEIILLNKKLVIEFGGLHGIRDKNLLESAIYQPQVTFGHKYLYDTLFKMSACYAVGLIKNHPFIDGNKRTGMAAAIIFLKIHDIYLNTSDKDIFELAITIANSKLSIDDLANIFEEKTIY